MFGIKTIGHAFSVAFEDLHKGIQFTEKVIAKIATNPEEQAVTEALTALIPGIGPQAATIERAAFAALGELTSVLSKADAAVEAKLLDAGLDKTVLDALKQLIADAKPQLQAAGLKV